MSDLLSCETASYSTSFLIPARNSKLSKESSSHNEILMWSGYNFVCKPVCIISACTILPVFIGIWVFQDKFSLLLTKFLLKNCTPISFHIIEVIYFPVASLWKCGCFWNAIEPNGLDIWPRLSLWSWSKKELKSVPVPQIAVLCEFP